MEQNNLGGPKVPDFIPEGVDPGKFGIGAEGFSDFVAPPTAVLTPKPITDAMVDAARSPEEREAYQVWLVEARKMAKEGLKSKPFVWQPVVQQEVKSVVEPQIQTIENPIPSTNEAPLYVSKKDRKK